MRAICAKFLKSWKVIMAKVKSVSVGICNSIAVLTVVMLCACTPQKQPSKLQLNAEQYCREQGFRQGTNDFENCVETTKQEILAQVRGSYQRLIRGKDR